MPRRRGPAPLRPPPEGWHPHGDRAIFPAVAVKATDAARRLRPRRAGRGPGPRRRPGGDPVARRAGPRGARRALVGPAPHRHPRPTLVPGGRARPGLGGAPRRGLRGGADALPLDRRSARPRPGAQRELRRPRGGGGPLRDRRALCRGRGADAALGLRRAVHHHRPGAAPRGGGGRRGAGGGVAPGGCRLVPGRRGPGDGPRRRGGLGAARGRGAASPAAARRRAPAGAARGVEPRALGLPRLAGGRQHALRGPGRRARLGRVLDLGFRRGAGGRAGGFPRGRPRQRGGG